ncbi:MAG: 3'-5' exonuclease, partial [Dehalococcoidales bacterium]
TPHIARALTGFTKMMEELIARSQEVGLAELFDRVMECSGYREYLMTQPGGEERWENVLELRTVAQQYSELEPKEALSMFLEEIALVNDTDGLGENPSAVTLITLHQAKGLEFPIVFIVGMEDGILPHFKSLDDPTQLEEERRLCYVGITRAEKRIYLVRAFRRSLMGRSEVNRPSRFLDDIPDHLVSGAGTWPGINRDITSTTTTLTSPSGELKAGDHVSHPVFGNGVVVSCQTLDGDIEVTVAFNGAGIKKLLSSFARLKKEGQAP